MHKMLIVNVYISIDVSGGGSESESEHEMSKKNFIFFYFFPGASLDSFSSESSWFMKDQSVIGYA